MNRAWLQFVVLVLVVMGAQAQPAISDATSARVPSRLPLPPLPMSPVDTFRMLLATNEAGREQWLSLRKPEQRDIVQAKIIEFSSLSEEAREARLQALQLRWYLPQLMQLSAADRAVRLKQIPEPDRQLLADKLKTWEILPPPIRQDLLENQLAISVFVAARHGTPTEVLPRVTAQPGELDKQVKQFSDLPAHRREQAIANFERFFSLPTNEQSKALQKLTTTDVAHMQQTLTRLDQLPPEQRAQALAGFKKFSELSPADRAAFLKSAERWQAMSEAERERWRKTVARLRGAGAIPTPPMPSVKGRPTTALAGP